jgi:hypothetical protein
VLREANVFGARALGTLAVLNVTDRLRKLVELSVHADWWKISVTVAAATNPKPHRLPIA